MSKSPWKCESHNYDAVTVISSNETFLAPRCTSCNEHRTVTAIRKFLEGLTK